MGALRDTYRLSIVGRLRGQFLVGITAPPPTGGTTNGPAEGAGDQRAEPALPVATAPSRIFECQLSATSISAARHYSTYLGTTCAMTFPTESAERSKPSLPTWRCTGSVSTRTAHPRVFNRSSWVISRRFNR